MAIKAVVLAAGEGTRLRPLTERCPKPMLPIGGKPLLVHIIEFLRAQGLRQIAINLHYQPQAIVGSLGDGSAYGVELTYSWEDPILGTAGGVKKLEPFLDSTFLVYYGDVLTNLDLRAMLAAHRGHGGLGTIALYEARDPERRGIAELDASGRLLRFLEKPQPGKTTSRLANAGLYLLEPEILAEIPEGRFCDFGSDLFPQLLAQGKPLYGYPIGEAYLIDIGSTEHYRQAQEDYAQGRWRPMPQAVGVKAP